jgi:hypothetical protein
MHDHENFSRRLMDISDQIAEINRRILERSKTGEPRCEKDDALLLQLTAEMSRPRTSVAA